MTDSLKTLQACLYLAAMAVYYFAVSLLLLFSL